MKMKKFRTVLAYLILIIGIIIVSVAGFYLFRYFNGIRQAENQFDDLSDMIDNSYENRTNGNGEHELALQPKRDYTKLFNENSDFVGWIKIDGTNIDYPVMQTPKQEDYYLHKNFYKNYDVNGVPFCNAAADLVRPSDNIVIYGHHMRGGNMFQPLDDFKDQTFAEEHNTFTFDTIYRWGTYKVIAVYLTDVNYGCFEYWNVVDCTEEEFDEYINFMKKKTLYKNDDLNEVEYGDKLVSLSTCAYHVTNGRLIVVGKLIESEETEYYKNFDLEKYEKNREEVKKYSWDDADMDDDTPGRIITREEQLAE